MDIYYLRFVPEVAILVTSEHFVHLPTYMKHLNINYENGINIKRSTISSVLLCSNREFIQTWIRNTPSLCFHPTYVLI